MRDSIAAAGGFFTKANHEIACGCGILARLFHEGIYAHPR